MTQVQETFPEAHVYHNRPNRDSLAELGDIPFAKSMGTEAVIGGLATAAAAIRPHEAAVAYLAVQTLRTAAGILRHLQNPQAENNLTPEEMVYRPLEMSDIIRDPNFKDSALEKILAPFPRFTKRLLKVVGATAFTLFLANGGIAGGVSDLLDDKEKPDTKISTPVQPSTETPPASVLPADSCPVFTPLSLDLAADMSLTGDTSHLESVAWLQVIMAQNGYYNYDINSDFSELTESALIGLETDMRDVGYAIEVDGIFDEFECKQLVAALR